MKSHSAVTASSARNFCLNGQRACPAPFSIAQVEDDSSLSKARNQLVVIGVRANPEPDEVFAVAHAQCATTKTRANGVNGQGWMDLLETQTRMIRVLLEQP